MSDAVRNLEDEFRRELFEATARALGLPASLVRPDPNDASGEGYNYASAMAHLRTAQAIGMNPEAGR